MKRFCTFLAVIAIAATAFAATSSQIEQFYNALGQNAPARNRAGMVETLSSFGGHVSSYKNFATLAQTVATDQSDATAQQWVDGSASAVVGDFAGWSYSGKTGVNALAQLIADFSETAGQTAAGNKIRITAGGTLVPVDQDQ